MNDEPLKTDPDSLTLEQLAEALEEDYVSRFAGLETEVSAESREFMTLLYRNGVADGLRLAITMLMEAQNYNPKYNDFPEMSKLVVVGMWKQAAEPITALASVLLDKVKASYVMDEDEPG